MTSGTEILYVTNVDADRDLLKIWGQLNRTCALYIEKQMEQLTPQINVSEKPQPSRLRKNMFCFARPSDGSYLRARVLDIRGNLVKVYFIDLGSTNFVDICNIRINTEGTMVNVLAKMAEQAEEFYLARVSAPPGGWDKKVLEELRRELWAEDVDYQVIAQVGDQRIVQLNFRKEDYSYILVHSGKAKKVSVEVQQQMILSYSLNENDNLKKQIEETQQPNYILPPQNMPGSNYPQSFAHFHSANERLLNIAAKAGMLRQGINIQTEQLNPRVPSPVINQQPLNLVPSVNQVNTALHSVANTSSAPINPYFSPTYTQPQVNEQDIQNFNPYNQYNPIPQVNPTVAAVTPVTPITPVTPMVNNAMIEAIAAQLRQQMAEEKSKTPKEPEKLPLQFDQNVLEVGTSYKVYISYIDDGPWSFSIQLVTQEDELNRLMDELAVAELLPVRRPITPGRPCVGKSVEYQNLCRGIVLNVTHNAVKVYFVDFGNTEDLPMNNVYEIPPEFFKTKMLSQKFALSGLQKVPASEEIKSCFKEVVMDKPLLLRVSSLEGDSLPTCELYLQDKNIKRLLNDKVKQLRLMQSEPFPHVGETVQVVATWVETTDKFFVQLRKKDHELQTLKQELATHASNGRSVTMEHLRPGLGVVCQYGGDDEWYRAVIQTIDSPGAVKVFYVDYGNVETVHPTALRRIEGGLISQMNTQALRCCLHGFENKPFNQELNNALEVMILEKTLDLKVVSTEKDYMVVKLSDNGVDIGESLLAPPPAPTPVYTPPVKSPPQQPYSAGADEWQNEPPTNQYNRENRGFNRSDDRNRNDRFEGRATRFGGRDQDSHGEKSFGNKPRDNEETWREKSDTWREKIDTWKDNRDNWRDNQEGRGNRRESRDNKGGWNDNRDKVQERSDAWNEGKDNAGAWNDNRDSRRNFDSTNDEGRRRFEDRNKFDRRGDFGEKKSFSRGGDFGGRPERPRREGDDGRPERPKRYPVRRDDAAPPGSTWREDSIEIGSTRNAIVTYYFNPFEFYVQSLTQDEQFKTMMNEIQTYYVQKFWCKDPPQKGDIVIAKFPVDKVLYRAEVVENSPLKVKYVDYGNEEVVDNRSVYVVDKKFLDLPKQAVKCKLSGVQPTGGKWPEPGGELDRFFESEEYKCTYLNCVKGIYEVSLESTGDGKDVAAEIRSAGFAAPVGATAEATESGIVPVDLSLLVNGVFAFYVVHIESLSKFYVHTNFGFADAIQEEVNKYLSVSKNFVPLDASAIQVGTLCISTNGTGVWYRAKIVQLTETGAVVQFLEYGDTAEVTSDQLFAIPEKLSKFQPQALECCIYGCKKDVAEDVLTDFATNVEQELLGLIHGITDNRIEVTLYDLTGSKCNVLKNLNDAPEEIEPVCSCPILTQRRPVLVPYFASPLEIYVSRLEDADSLTEFAEKLNAFYAENGEEFDPKNAENLSKLCAAKSEADHCWYRSRLLSCAEDTAKVHYVDYGNAEDVPHANLKKLDGSSYVQHIFAKKVSLNVKCLKKERDDVTAKLGELINGKDLTAYFIQADDVAYVELLDNGVRITDAILDENVTREVDLFKDLIASSEVAEDSAKAEDVRRVFVTHVNGPHEFWVHFEEAVTEIDSQQEKLQELCPDLSDSIPESSKTVAALFADDLQWYRAVITNVTDSVVTVQFVDYGNNSEIDVRANPLKELSEDLRNAPPFANCCRLKGIWKEEANAKFDEMVQTFEDSVLIVFLEETSSGLPLAVDLFVNGKSVTEMLLESGCGSPEVEKQILGDRAVATAEQPAGQPASGSTCKVFITHANSPDDFYLQKENASEILDVVDAAFADADDFEDVTADVKINELCVAKFPEDQQWYRAKVTQKSPEEIEVFFIDYGNSSVVTEVKKMPETLKELPAAQNCSLVYGETNDKWSDEACLKFQEYADGRSLTMEVVVDGTRKQIVKLFTNDDKNVSEELEALCVPDGRFEVYVSHVNSTNDFYVQKAEDENLTKVTEAIANADGFQDLDDREAGTVCAARFVDDELWYRAVILSKTEESCEVRFVDYGNVAEAYELKKLPAELAELKPVARNCALDFKLQNIPESVKEEFINLTGEGATIFKAAVITSGVDKDVISLKFNGYLLETSLIMEEFPDGCAGTVEGTDDDKSKTEIRAIVNSVAESYNFNMDDDSRARNSMRNETDEEKTVKALLSPEGTSEGFKSDDEKGVETAVAVNVPDNELEGSAVDPAISEVAEYHQEQFQEAVSADPAYYEGDGQESGLGSNAEAIPESEETEFQDAEDYEEVFETVTETEEFQSQIAAETERRAEDSGYQPEQEVEEFRTEIATTAERQSDYSTDKPENKVEGASTDAAEETGTGTTPDTELTTTEYYSIVGDDDTATTEEIPEDSLVKTSEERTFEESTCFSNPSKTSRSDVKTDADFEPESTWSVSNASKASENKDFEPESTWSAGSRDKTAEIYEEPKFQDKGTEKDTSMESNLQDFQEESSPINIPRNRTNIRNKAGTEEEPSPIKDVNEEPDGWEPIVGKKLRKPKIESDKKVSDVPEPDPNVCSKTFPRRKSQADKIVPGSISRGVSYETVINNEETVTNNVNLLSASAPVSPALTRKPPYRKISHTERIVPACISSGSPVNEESCAIQSGKIPHSEKLPSGSSPK